MVNFKDKTKMVNFTMKKETRVGRIDPRGGGGGTLGLLGGDVPLGPWKL